jgi:TetR/AcrR family transcriptional repressor of nem operon
MRVSKEQAAENRERILKAASRLIRERGISGAGVDALTEAAGMTHGSLYSQFGSKERLVEEALTT